MRVRSIILLLAIVTSSLPAFSQNSVQIGPTKTKADSENALQLAQLEQVRLTNEKLRFEVAELGKSGGWSAFMDRLVPVITALVAVAGFLLGIAQYVQGQKKAQETAQEEQKKNRETAEREFMKPWLESQRAIYMKALSSAATVANSRNSSDRRRAADEFWKLYHGRMILVETTKVSGAMVKFGQCLEAQGTVAQEEGIIFGTDEMNSRLRILATAMAESMAATAKMTFQEFSANQFKYTSGE